MHHPLAMLRWSIIPIVWIAIGSASAEDQIPVQFTGIGRMSCAYWQSSAERFSEGGVWLYGYWTALNYVAATGNFVESKIDAAGIVAVVLKTCSVRPSQGLSKAAWQTWGELTKTNE
jgi:hypothetical protein